MKLYVLIENWATGYETGHNINIFSEKSSAIREMEKRITELEKDGCLGSIVEHGETSFCTYNEGEYAENHTAFDIEEKELSGYISFEDYLKPEIEMWIENYRDDVELEEYTNEMLDKIDVDEIATKIADNEYITEF